MCICSSINIIHVGKEYHHYDFFVYPRAMELYKGNQGAAKGFWNIIGWGSDGKDEALSSMARRCLSFYLEPYRNILLEKGEYPEEFELGWFTQQVEHVYRLHRWPMVENLEKKNNPVVQIHEVRKLPFCNEKHSNCKSSVQFPCARCKIRLINWWDHNFS